MTGRPSPLRLFLAIAMVFCCVQAPCLWGAATVPTESEKQAAHAWTATHLAPEADGAAVTPPFSFTYRGEPSAQLLAKWACQREQNALDDQARNRH